MHIVQLTTELLPAGAERVVLNLGQGLIEAGHTVTVIALKPLPAASFVVDGLREAGARVESVGISKWHPWALLGLKKLVREMRPDLVHAHLFHANLVSRFSCAGLGVPLVNSVHIAERRPGKGWHFTLDRWTLGCCTVQTGVSKAVCRYHTDKLGQPEASMPVVYNGIDPPEQLTAGEVAVWRERWGVGDCNRVIGSVGRLDWQKGYDVLLGAMGELGACVPEDERWAVVIVGEGSQRDELEALAAAAPENVVVKLPGFDPEAARAAGAFDLFVMPSRYEGFGLTLAEAMGHGGPILASNVDSLPELIEAYALGETLDFGQASGKEIARQLVSGAGKERGKPDHRFDTSHMVQAYLDLYTELAAAASR